MTLEDAIDKASSMFLAEGFQNEDSRWQAKVLVAYTASLKPSQLYLEHNFQLNIPQKEKLFLMVKQRISGVPLQHVIGEWDFYAGNHQRPSGHGHGPEPVLHYSAR